MQGFSIFRTFQQSLYGMIFKVTVMRDMSVGKKLLSLALTLTFLLGIFYAMPAEDVYADMDEASTGFSNALSVSDEIIVSNGIYKIFSKDSVAFLGLADSNTESFVVPNAVRFNNVLYKVVWIAQSAFEGNSTIKNVFIGKNVYRVCSRAFAGCSSLTSVTGGKGVLYTADDAYENCPKLKKPGRYYYKTYNVGLAYIGKAPKPWRSKKVKAGRNGKAEYTWITDKDLQYLGMTRESFGNAVLAACRKMAGTVYTNQNDCISYCLSAYAKALGVATSVGKGQNFKIRFSTKYKSNKKVKYAANLMKKKKVLNISGGSISRKSPNWFHCTNFMEGMLSKPDCYGGVRISDYGTLADTMKALNAQPGDIVLFGGYVTTYLCKDGKYYKGNYGAHGGKKKVNGHYVRGEGGLFVWGHATIYCGQNFTYTDRKGTMRTGQWFYETSNKSHAGLHWREPYYYAGETNQRVMVIHIGDPKAAPVQNTEDPIVKALGNDAVPGAKYGFYKCEEDAARDFDRLCTYTCGQTTDIPEINLGRAYKYDIDSYKRLTAKFYIRRLTDTGSIDPDAKAYVYKMRPSDKYDLPLGWVKLAS